MKRRSFLQACLAAAAGPAILKVEALGLMPARARTWLEGNPTAAHAYNQPTVRLYSATTLLAEMPLRHEVASDGVKRWAADGVVLASGVADHYEIGYGPEMWRYRSSMADLLISSKVMTSGQPVRVDGSVKMPAGAGRIQLSETIRNAMLEAIFEPSTPAEPGAALRALPRLRTG